MPLWTALRNRRTALSEDTPIAGFGPATNDLPSPTPTGSPARGSRWAERALVVAAIGFVLWFYGWTVVVNSGFDDWGDLDYYRLQVRGWLKGQLHLDKAPAPEMLQLADPYDPFQNAPYKLGDATFYQGRYYIYFGAAPALTLMLPYRLLTGQEMSTGMATLILASSAFLAASAIWLSIRRRYFRGSIMVMAPAGVLAIGFGTHLLALCHRPMFWELAIAGGIAFSTLATAAAYWAIHGRRPILAMATSGLCIGLAVGSRPICVLAAPLLAVPIYVAWRQRHRSQAQPPAIDRGTAPPLNRSWLTLAVAAGVPLAACAIAIMAHNYARFHNPFEFGQHYQLSGAHEGKLTHFSLRFLPHNAAVYFLHPLEWEAEFPFAAATKVPVPDIAEYFGSEEVSGLAATFPFYWFLLVLPLAWWRRGPGDARALSAALAVIAAYAVPVMLVVLCYFSTTMRYQADFAVPLAVLATTGMLALERRVAGAVSRTENPALSSPRRPRTALAGAFAVFAIVPTVLAGVLVSFDYHGRTLFTTSYPMWSAFADAKHQLIDTIVGWTGQVEGPRVIKVRFQPRPAGTTETIWQATDSRAQERILVQYLGEQRIRFGHQRGTAEPHWGHDLTWKRNHTHTVTVQLPSLYPPPADEWGSRVRRHLWFRERTAVAVWFSGGRALERVLEPLPTGFTPGGVIGRDFSGEVRKITHRPFRADEVAWGPAAYYERRGGILQMRVIFPDRIAAEGEPLFSSGERHRSTMLFAVPTDGGLKIVFQNSDEPRVESALVRPNPQGHVVEIEMPTFRPESYGWEDTGDVVVRIDGREILRTKQVTAPYLAGTEQFGRNLLGPTCRSHFAGWIFDVKWLAAVNDVGPTSGSRALR